MVSQWNKSFYSISYILWVKRGNIFHFSELFWLRMKNKTTSQLPVNWKIYICQWTHLFFFSIPISVFPLSSLPIPSHACLLPVPNTMHSSEGMKNISGLGKILVPGKPPGVHEDDPRKTPCSGGEGTWTAHLLRWPPYCHQKAFIQ